MSRSTRRSSASSNRPSQLESKTVHRKVLRLSLAPQCAEVARILKLLAHPERLRILMELIDGERSVGELTKCCDGSQSQTSQFLIRLKLEGLLEHRREGRSVLYRIADPRIEPVLHALRRCFC